MEKIRSGPHRLFSYLCCSALVFTHTGYKPVSQTPGSTEYKLKAVFLYNFTQFVEWPESEFENAEPFVIGVLGDDPFDGLLEKTVHNEYFRGHPMEVRHYTTPGQTDECHILFVSTSGEKALEETLGILDHEGILTVGDAQNFARTGGVIGFVTVAGKVRLQINRQAAARAGLEISPKLLRLAELVE